MKNESPWLKELNDGLKLESLTKHQKSEVLIIGGGIAGVVTAYFILKNTNASVSLLEGGKIAHAATGHNAGHLAHEFEKPLYKIAETWNEEMAVYGQECIYSAWGLLDEILKDTKLDIRVDIIDGGLGITEDHLEDALLDARILGKNSKGYDKLYVNKYYKNTDLLKEFEGYFEFVNPKKIDDMIGVHNIPFAALKVSKTGILNSAKFTRNLAEYLLKKYKGRISIFEDSMVENIILSDNRNVVLTDEDYKIEFEKLVLCTNGFINMNIINLDGENIDDNFKDLVVRQIGYIQGYESKRKRTPKPRAIALHQAENTKRVNNDYIYLTSRRFNDGKDLVCIGGPVSYFPELRNYYNDIKFSVKNLTPIRKFVAKHLGDFDEKYERKYQWHGIMGYTKDGVRLIGTEPRNPDLLYNLGCNGVGILPSIFGAYKISRILNNEVTQADLFDPD